MTARNRGVLPRPAPARRALIAHGDGDTRALYAEVLERLGYVVEECEDGATALGKALCAPPDLLIAAVQLWRIDGINLCRMLRTEPQTRRITLALITTGQSVDEVRAKSAGADAAIGDPCTPEALAATLEKVGSRDGTENRPPPTDAAIQDPTGRRRPRSRLLRREQTITPPLAPPRLHCPQCHLPLIYQYSQTGGVSERWPEQWDYFLCENCGPQRYRHRTRELRAIW